MKPAFHTSLIKLLSVATVFYASYGFTNWLSAQRYDVAEIVFAWEYAIPFLPWTILPYWSLNFFYALAFFLCQNVHQQHRYIAQLLIAQAISISAFLLFPLQFSWEKPQTDSLFGSLFSALAIFDQPYNQAPSLHIILSLIVGRFYWYRLAKPWRIVWLIWCALIMLSVLTTWQHHFIDIPTGLFVGALVLWALPWHGNEALTSPLHQKISITKQHQKWTIFYLLIAALCSALASLGGYWLWCLWPAISCLFVAAAYARFGASLWQKQANGEFSLAITLLLLPHRIAMTLNRKLWLRHQPTNAEIIAKKLYIGSIADANKFNAVLDVCAELPIKHKPTVYASIPMLDMVTPSISTLQHSAHTLQRLLTQQSEPVLVCCALGYGRSVAVVLLWLLRYGNISTIEDAIAIIKSARPKMVLPTTTRETLRLAANNEINNES